jgi:hypothetical protein
MMEIKIEKEKEKVKEKRAKYPTGPAQQGWSDVDSPVEQALCSSSSFSQLHLW